MRTTVTLAPDTDAHVRRLMQTRNLTFGQALNEAIRAGIAIRPPNPVQFTFPRRMGVPAVPVDKALQLAGQLEDEEIVRKLALEK